MALLVFSTVRPGRLGEGRIWTAGPARRGHPILDASALLSSNPSGPTIRR
jgi:hypothetical protein